MLFLLPFECFLRIFVSWMAVVGRCCCLLGEQHSPAMGTSLTSSATRTDAVSSDCSCVRVTLSKEWAVQSIGQKPDVGWDFP